MKTSDYQLSLSPPLRRDHFSFPYFFVVLLILIFIIIVFIVLKGQTHNDGKNKTDTNYENNTPFTSEPKPDNPDNPNNNEKNTSHRIVCSFLLEEELIKNQLVFYENNFGVEKVDCLYFSATQRESMLHSIPYLKDNNEVLQRICDIYSSVNPHYEVVRSWIFGLWHVYEYGGWYVRFMEYLPNSLFQDKNIWIHNPTVWVEKSLTITKNNSKNHKHDYPFYNWSALYCRKRHHPAIHSLLVRSLSILSKPETFQGKEWPSPTKLSDPQHKLFFVLFTPLQRMSLGHSNMNMNMNNWSTIIFPFRWLNQRVPNPCYHLSTVYEYANKIHEEPVILPKRTQTIPRQIFLTWKDNTLPKKVLENWKTLNPSYTIHLYTDDDCYEFLLQTFSKDYADFFREIPFGPIKADWWRICILYVYGGVYVDADVEPIGVPFDSILHDCTSFTCIGNTNDHVFQAILAFPANDPILKECITLLYDKRPRVQNYIHQNKNDFSFYGPLSGTSDMYQSILRFFNQHKIYGDSYYILPKTSMTSSPYILKLAQEGCGEDYSTCTSFFNTVPLFKSRYANYVSEWMVHDHAPGKFL